MADQSGLWSELRRRRVPRTIAAYAFVMWLLLQAGEILLPAFVDDPDGIMRWLFFLAIGGAPVCIWLAWFYQITGEGIVRTDAFEERRALNNIPPLNDRRREKASQLLGANGGDYRWSMLFESGPLAELSYAVLDTLTIGRALECEISVISNHVSRKHVQLSVDEEGQLWAQDLDSANGTLVNGTAISEKTQLKHDDELAMQDIRFRVLQRYSREISESSSMSTTQVVHRADIQPEENS